MQFPRAGAGVVRLFGYILFAYGLVSTLLYLIFQIRYSIGPDMGIVLGNGAITLIGLVALSVATCLVQLEKRLDRLESAPESAAKPSE